MTPWQGARYAANRSVYASRVTLTPRAASMSPDWKTMPPAPLTVTGELEAGAAPVGATTTTDVPVPTGRWVEIAHDVELPYADGQADAEVEVEDEDEVKMLEEFV